MARILGPSGKGALSLILTIPTLLVIFSGAGLGAANVYFAGSRRLSVSVLSRNSVAMALTATLAGTILISALQASGRLAIWLPNVSVALVIVVIIALPAQLLNDYFSGILLGLRNIFKLNIITLIQNLLILVLTGLAIVGLNLGVIGGALAALSAWIIRLVITCYALRKEGGRLMPHWQWPILRMTLNFGSRSYIGNLFQFFNYRLDLFLVNFYMGSADVGLYSIAVALAELLWYLPHSVGYVIFPQAAATDARTMNLFTPRVFRITLIISLLGGIFLALTGKLLIGKIYPAAFLGAYPALLILLPGVILLGGAKVLTNEIAGRGFPHYNSINSALALVMTVGLDLLLIPRHGISGAALASTLSYTLCFILALWFYRRVVQISRVSHSPS